MPDPLQIFGQMVFGAAVFGAAVGAYWQVFGTHVWNAEGRAGSFADLRQATGWAIAVAAAQAAFLMSAYFVPVMHGTAGVAWFYLAGAALIPLLWTAGKAQAATLNWPTNRFLHSQWHKLIVLAGLTAAGMAGSIMLFTLADVQPGAAVEEVTETVQGASALAALVIWLMINAPWLEELCFRHYLLPVLARWWGGGCRAVVAAVLTTAFAFALGHSAHMEPAWPKLLQVTGWGVVLGCVRIFMGTPYAIMLHLAWNLTAPVVALAIT